jgi:ABC-type Fe3+ transport system substrate-binding protein
MVRGRYPIAIGLNGLALQDFQAHGVGKNVKTWLLPELDYQSSGSGVWLLNRAPHPNAAKLFVNWLLTKDAQIAWAKELQTNSRFVGVEPGDPQAVVPPGLTLLQIDAEEQLPELIKTQDISRQLIR